MELDILCKHSIQLFILNAGYSVHDQPNYNSPNMKLENMYGNAIMNWMIQHGSLKFTPAHINSVRVATWEAFKISSATITHNTFNNTHILPLSPPDIDTNHQTFLAVTQQLNIEKADDIGKI